MEQDQTNAPQQAPALPSTELTNPRLTAEEQLCAVLEGTKRFKHLQDIAEYLGRTKFWIYNLRKNPDYRALVQATVAAVAERLTQDAADVASLFNEQIRPSVATLVEVRDDPFNKAGDRIKASLGLIDHAPAAPQRKVDAPSGLVFQIPYPQLEGIKQALQDDDEGDLVELLEGRDFETQPMEIEAAGPEFRVPVREVE